MSAMWPKKEEEADEKQKKIAQRPTKADDDWEVDEGSASEDTVHIPSSMEGQTSTDTSMSAECSEEDCDENRNLDAVGPIQKKSDSVLAQPVQQKQRNVETQSIQGEQSESPAKGSDIKVQKKQVLGEKKRAYRQSDKEQLGEREKPHMSDVQTKDLSKDRETQVHQTLPASRESGRTQNDSTAETSATQLVRCKWSNTSDSQSTWSDALETQSAHKWTDVAETQSIQMWADAPERLSIGEKINFLDTERPQDVIEAHFGLQPKFESACLEQMGNKPPESMQTQLQKSSSNSELLQDKRLRVIENAIAPSTEQISVSSNELTEQVQSAQQRSSVHMAVQYLKVVHDPTKKGLATSSKLALSELMQKEQCMYTNAQPTQYKSAENVDVQLKQDKYNETSNESFFSPVVSSAGSLIDPLPIQKYQWRDEAHPGEKKVKDKFHQDGDEKSKAESTFPPTMSSVYKLQSDQKQFEDKEEQAAEFKHLENTSVMLLCEEQLDSISTNKPSTVSLTEQITAEKNLTKTEIWMEDEKLQLRNQSRERDKTPARKKEEHPSDQLTHEKSETRKLSLDSAQRLAETTPLSEKDNTEFKRPWTDVEAQRDNRSGSVENKASVMQEETETISKVSSKSSLNRSLSEPEAESDDSPPVSVKLILLTVLAIALFIGMGIGFIAVILLRHSRVRKR